MNKHFFSFLFLVLIVVTSFIYSNKSYAQYGGVLVYPNIIEMDFTDNNRFVSKAIQVENPSDKPFRVRAYVESWKLNEFGGIEFLDKPDPSSLSDYIKFNPREFDLAPGQRQLVRLTSKIPEGNDGEYRSIIFFETVQQKDEILAQSKDKVNVSVNFKTRYGVALYAYKGMVSKNASLKNLVYEKIDNKPYIIATLRNDGNIHCNVDGELILVSENDTNGIKNQVGKYTILPVSNQKYRIQLPEDILNNGNYTVMLKLNYKDIEDRVQALEGQTKFNYKSTASYAKKELRNINSVNEVKKTPDNVARPVNNKGHVIPVDLDTEIKLKN